MGDEYITDINWCKLMKIHKRQLTTKETNER